jgi:hypothetical protein
VLVFASCVVIVRVAMLKHLDNVVKCGAAICVAVHAEVDWSQPG